MSVMAAGVHDAGIAAGIGQPGRLLDRQRIHVGANADPLLAVAAPEGGDDAGAGNARRHLVAPGGKVRCHKLAGSELLEGKLRILVEIVAKRDDLVEVGSDALLDRIVAARVLSDDIHDGSPALQAPTAFPRSSCSASAA